jgi:N-acetylglucosaminyl-diphospho-decaprenol L-rhamnosyltransferase
MRRGRAPIDVISRAAEMDIVIVHYHAAGLVRDAVAALRADAVQSNLLLNIIVADNGSTAEERALLQSLGVDCFDTGKNAGYAGAINASFPRSRSDFIVLMNEDVIVLPGCLRTLQAALASGAAIAGPQFYWDRDCVFRLPCTEERTRSNEIAKLGGKRTPSRLQHARLKWREHARRHWRSLDPLATTSLSGALLAFRRDTWTTIGPFDEQFTLYFEENDWLLRIAKAVLVSQYVPSAKAIHLHNPRLTDGSERAQWEAESFRRFGDRHYGERFMRRLLLANKRETIVPHWLLAGGESFQIDIPGDCVWPLWVELSPSAFGFPAATTCIADQATTYWRLPAMRGLEFLCGTFYVQVVDDIGRELGGYSFRRNAKGSKTDFGPGLELRK